MPGLQEWIHKLEVGEGARYLKYLTALIGLLALTVLYDLIAFKNLSTQEAMDMAQLGRNIAEGKGYHTDFVRPLSIQLLESHRADKSAQLDGNHPDLANPPVYPFLLAGWLKIMPFSYDIPTGKTFTVYQPDRWIAVLNQILFFLALWLVYALGKRLFDAGVGAVATMVMAGTHLLWEFGISGLSTMLLIVLFLLVAHALAGLEEGSRLEEEAPGKKWFAARALWVGLLVGAGMMTRYSFGWMIVPVLGFLIFFLPGRRLLTALCAGFMFLVVVTPWLARNHAECGHLFGTAGFAVYEQTGSFPGDQLPRSLNADLSRVGPRDFIRKFLVNAKEMVSDPLPLMGGNWVAGFFLAGWLMVFRNPLLNRMRYFLLGGIGILFVVQALGETHLTQLSPVVNSENLLIVLAPLVIIYGTGFFFVLLDNLELPLEQLRTILIGLMIILFSAPLILALLPPRTMAVAYPPYYPPMIRQAAGWMNSNELIMSDIPWSVAWYGQRSSLWTTLRIEPDFYAIHDYHKAISALYLSPKTTNADLADDVVEGRDPWARLYMDGLIRENLPTGFPLTRARSDYLPDQFFLADRERWRF